MALCNDHILDLSRSVKILGGKYQNKIGTFFVLICNANNSQNSISKEAYAQKQQERTQSALFLPWRYVVKNLSIDLLPCFFIKKYWEPTNRPCSYYISDTVETRGFLFTFSKP